METEIKRNLSLSLIASEFSVKTQIQVRPKVNCYIHGFPKELQKSTYSITACGTLPELNSGTLEFSPTDSIWQYRAHVTGIFQPSLLILQVVPFHYRRGLQVNASSRIYLWQTGFIKNILSLVYNFWKPFRILF